MVDSRYVHKLDLTIDPDLQLKILRPIISSGEEAPSEKNLMPSFWISGGMRDVKSYPEGLSKYETQRYSYLARGAENLDWQWLDVPGVEEVRNLLTRNLDKLLLSINRVSIIIQKPGFAVPAHRDLIVGSTYINMKEVYSTFLGDKKLTYQGEEWFHKRINVNENTYHKDQGYYGLRIPISERPGENGAPFIENSSGEKMYYDCGNNLFLLNEAELEHGADPVDYYRGVIIVDGKLNISAI